MPYKSKAQQRMFHYLLGKKKISPKVVQEFDKATDFKELPETTGKKKTLKNWLKN